MEEVNNSQHSMGSGQQHQHPVNHTRPFFYVQPPSQPYYLYQWHMNNPFGHYGFHGSGLPFGRPYLPPYSYMHYPGYILPQAPVQPMDYRRMFPHFPSAGGYDLRFRYHQTRIRRETTTSEVQTEPNEAVEKLSECLGKMEACDISVEKEMDSGVASQAPGELGTQYEQPSPQPQRISKSGNTIFSDLAGTAYADANLCNRNASQRDEWSVSSCDGVSPLDTSSVHEDVCHKDTCLEEQEEQCVPSSSPIMCQPCVKVDLSSKPEKTLLAKDTPTGVFFQDLGQGKDGVESESSHDPSDNWLVNDGIAQECKNEYKLPALQANVEKTSQDSKSHEDLVHDEELHFRILKLPFHTILAGGEMDKENPLWSVDSLSNLITPSTLLSTFGNAYYGYYPQVAQERQSVLSASLDELSSRDEMFSTDVEDMDLVPGHIYTGKSLGQDNVEEQDHVDKGFLEEECPLCPRQRTCATCGCCLSQDAHGGLEAENDTSEEITDIVEDCESDSIKKVRDSRKVTNLKRTSHLKRSISSCSAIKHSSKLKPKKNLDEVEGSVSPDEQHQNFPGLGKESCEEHKISSKSEKHRGQDHHVHQKCQMERPCKNTVMSDQESWESYGAKPRSKPWKTYPKARDQERPPRRKMSCKTVVYQRPRRNEYDENEEGEIPRIQRGRGSSKRRGTRY
ncbi:bucky ball [Polypterus senegalus]|uniref:bucky ball n=1 Tax=Polypterus senegalus TaxID=55291 RepID=UPI001962BC3F|nr:bucky ball [Polypterus senegalus]